MDKSLFSEKQASLSCWGQAGYEAISYKLGSKDCILQPTMGADRKYLASGRKREVGEGFLEEVTITLSVRDK